MCVYICISRIISVCIAAFSLSFAVIISYTSHSTKNTHRPSTHTIGSLLFPISPFLTARRPFTLTGPKHFLLHLLLISIRFDSIRFEVHGWSNERGLVGLCRLCGLFHFISLVLSVFRFIWVICAFSWASLRLPLLHYFFYDIAAAAAAEIYYCFRQRVCVCVCVYTRVLACSWSFLQIHQWIGFMPPIAVSASYSTWSSLSPSSNSYPNGQKCQSGYFSANLTPFF